MRMAVSAAAPEAAVGIAGTLEGASGTSEGRLAALLLMLGKGLDDERPGFLIGRIRG
jgi:hypothetical protein